MSILLTGGAGFIGSHTAVELLNAGYDIVIADNFCNSSASVLDGIRNITGRPLKFYKIDIKNIDALMNLFHENKIETVIHFAGLKSVNQSIDLPIEYYRNNLDTTITLLECMKEYHVNKIIFSSSATVYGNASSMPCRETMKKGIPINPYGWTKYMNEQILEDASRANKDLSVVILRYFNPVGAHESGMLGENIADIPNNLMPYITRVANGELEKLTIFGNDYDTEDGTCLRDFIHIEDLANAHLKALEYIIGHKGLEIFNIGTGRAYSVLEIVNTFEKETGIKINYSFGPRRAGDIPVSYANVDKAKNVLHWEAKRNLNAMCKDAWNWQKNCNSN